MRQIKELWWLPQCKVVYALSADSNDSNYKYIVVNGYQKYTSVFSKRGVVLLSNNVLGLLQIRNLSYL